MDKVKYKNDFNKQKYDQILLMTQKGQKEILKEEAKKRNQSLNAFIISCIKYAITKNFS